MNDNLLVYNNCIESLENNNLIEAIRQIDILLQDSEDWNLRNERDAIQGNYQLLLKYLQNGVIDDKRNELYFDFIRHAFSLADKAYRDHKLKDSTEEYFVQLRTVLKRNLTIKKALEDVENVAQQTLFYEITSEKETQNTQETQKKKELLAQDLFNVIWTSPLWEDGEEFVLVEYFEAGSSDSGTRILLLGALMMTTIFFFTSKKFLLLLKLVRSKDLEIRSRALVGLSLVTFVHHRRFAFYPEIQKEIQELHQIPQIEEILTSLQINLLNVQNTQHVEQKINDEILPSIYRNQQSGIDFSKIDDLLNDDGDSDELLNNKNLKDLQKSVQNLIKMQDEGADMPFVTFSHLKTFPFFNTVANWFMPFDKAHTTLSNLTIVNPDFFQSILSSNMLCDSDKFSFCLMIENMPSVQRDMIQKSLAQQMGDNDLKNVYIEQASHDEANIQRLFLQDCFRFFSLFRNLNGITNPFKCDTLLVNYPLFANLFTDKDKLLKTAYFAHKQELWQMASAIFKYIDDNYTLPAEALQIYGYDLQKQRNYNQAILCFEKASIIDTESRWTKRHLGLCLLKTGNIQKALNVYSQFIQMEPEDKQVLLHYGECLSLNGKYEQALSQFFKLEYLDSQNITAIRAIAWCSLQSNNAKQANKYYQKLPSTKCSAQDYKNAGHAAWACNKLPEAISFYKKAKSLQTETAFSFSSSEKDLLVGYGISAMDILFVTDIVNL